MPEFRTAIPAFPVQNIARGVAFYSENLGFRCVHETDGYAVLIRGVELHLWRAADERWISGTSAKTPVVSGAESFLAGTHSCRIEVDDVDALHHEVTPKNILHPNADTPRNQPHGQREFSVLDHEGNLITFFQTL